MKRSRSPIAVILVVLLLALLLPALLGGRQDGEPVTFSQFLTQVDNGQVKSATVETRDNSVKVKTKTGRDYEVGYPEDYGTELVQDLRGHQVPFDVKDSRGNALCHILTYALPFLLFIGLWIFLIRHAGRRLEGDVVRQVAREAHVARRPEDHLPRRRGRGRGGRGAA